MFNASGALGGAPTSVILRTINLRLFSPERLDGDAQQQHVARGLYARLLPRIFYFCAHFSVRTGSSRRTFEASASTRTGDEIANSSSITHV